MHIIMLVFSASLEPTRLLSEILVGQVRSHAGYWRGLSLTQCRYQSQNNSCSGNLRRRDLSHTKVRFQKNSNQLASLCISVYGRNFKRGSNILRIGVSALSCFFSSPETRDGKRREPIRIFCEERIEALFSTLPEDF